MVGSVAGETIFVDRAVERLSNPVGPSRLLGYQAGAVWQRQTARWEFKIRTLLLGVGVALGLSVEKTPPPGRAPVPPQLFISPLTSSSNLYGLTSSAHKLGPPTIGVLTLSGVCAVSVHSACSHPVCANALLAGLFVRLSVSPCGHQRGTDPIISVSLFLLPSRSPQTHPSTYLPVHSSIHPSIGTSIIISRFKADSEWMSPGGGWEWGDACADFSPDLSPTRQTAIACNLP